MKRIVAQTLLLLLPFCLLFEAEEAKDGVDALLGTVNLSEWDAWFSKEAPDVPFRPSDFVRTLAGMEDEPDAERFFDRALAYALPSVKAAAAKLILFLGLAVLASILHGVHAPTSGSETAETAFRFAVSCLVLTSIVSEITTVYRLLGRIRTLSEWMLPVLLGFLTLGGMEHTAGALTSAFTLLSGGAIRLLRDAAAPICCIGGVLLSFDACAAGRLASIGRLFLRAAKWMLALISGGYGLLNAVRGAAAASADGLLLRTTRFALGSFPVVGGVVSDSVDTAFQCLLFVKNTLGVGGAVLILLLCAKPVLTVFLTRCALRIASAVGEPLSGKPYADLLRGLGDALHVLMLTEVAAVSMALIAVSPVFLTGGLA